MEDILYKHKKKIIVGGVLAVLAIVGVSVYNLIWNSIYSAKINIVVAPSIAKVVIDGSEYKTTGTYRVKPGEYEVEISADGFVSKKVNVVAVKGESVDLYEYLEPTEENANWYGEHEEDAGIMSAILIARADEASRKLAEENPILNRLPVEVEYYTSNYSSYVKYDLRYEISSENKITIIIDDYSGGNKKLAMEKLESFEYSLDKYKIKYNDKSIKLTYE